MLLGLMIQLHMAGSPAATFPDVADDGFQGEDTVTKQFHLAKSLQCSEIVSPSAPASQNGILFVKDNGAGKMQLTVIFPTGAEQVIATEP